MCPCHLLYPGYICDAHRRQLECEAGRHHDGCHDILPRAEFEKLRDATAGESR